MGNLGLPEHMVAWCEEQVALGRVASVGTYLAQLITQDKLAQEALARRQLAIADARDSGISMRDPESVLAVWLSPPSGPSREGLRQAIRDGRESGYSMASIEGILARALGVQMVEAA